MAKRGYVMRHPSICVVCGENRGSWPNWILHPQCEPRAAEIRAEQERRVERCHKLVDRRREVRAWIGSSLLPTDFRHKTLRTYQPAPENLQVIAALDAWRPSSDYGFLIQGKTGVGKTHLGMALLHRAARRYQRDLTVATLPAYAPVGFFLESVRESMGVITRRILNASALLMDDLGAENCTDYAREVIFKLLEHRGNHKLPTIVTTNLDLNELRTRLHERISSRLIGMTVPVNLEGVDYRQRRISSRIEELQTRAREKAASRIRSFVAATAED
jgi:DNA replication protein DnaC